jgi:hypothetical protein
MAWSGQRGGHSRAAAKGWGHVKSSGTMYAHAKQSVRVTRIRDSKRRLRVTPAYGRKRP